VDEKHFKSTFASAWTHLVTADRFDGPSGNLCQLAPPQPATGPITSWAVILVACASSVIVVALVAAIVMCCQKRRQQATYEEASQFDTPFDYKPMEADPPRSVSGRVSV
jgi:heme/copper-type cytochrome/quinol oxidase subunit 2